MTKISKRKVIIRAAFERIAENGFHDAPMSMLAEHANVSAGSIYRYFKNKDALICELYKDLQERMYPVILGNYKSNSPIRARFLYLGTALLRYFIENPLDFRFAEQFHNSPYGITYYRFNIKEKKDGCDFFRQLFDDGVSQQVMKALPLVILYSLSVGPLLAVARDHINGFIELDEHLTHLTVEACWNSIRN